ncbi:SRPBCC family protein [Gordonia alkanivorans]|uniref:SRPBCC family protein n=1 Tax=Gordonia alkanivorans TaxID=84096 RepID=UPI0024478566|nr:SRPBCC family protein [Gordonia alkanivorans]MDH3008545.1 SRPBCC family protein [Gordonia alkanivorans]MDH3017725.1 SRPBCC family protein [Gordonia alkanivorans]MDH3043118.1 SRPBCC family protein [Gordonia alkanivorans]MDH3061345.1 SRPBCC family protein [Gordonia alkanivorans]
MGVVRHQAVVGAPRGKVFEYVGGYQNVPEYLMGVTRFEPRTEQTQGLGSVFELSIDVGPKKLKSVVECTRYVVDELIELKAIEGFQADTTWRFLDADTGTELQVEFSYTLPGGIAGRVLGGIVGPFAAQAIKHTESTIVKNVAARG